MAVHVDSTGAVCVDNVRIACVRCLEPIRGAYSFTTDPENPLLIQHGDIELCEANGYTAP